MIKHFCNKYWQKLYKCRVMEFCALLHLRKSVTWLWNAFLQNLCAITRQASGRKQSRTHESSNDLSIISWYGFSNDTFFWWSCWDYFGVLRSALQHDFINDIIEIFIYRSMPLVTKFCVMISVREDLLMPPLESRSYGNSYEPRQRNFNTLSMIGCFKVAR